MKKAMTPKRAQVQAVMRLLQKVQHAVPGVVLLKDGVATVAEGASGWHLPLAAAEIATAGAVAVSLMAAFRTLARNIRSGQAPHLHVGIDWTDIFLGLMLFTEVASRYPEHHKLWRPATLLGIVMIILGLFGGKIIQWKAGKSAIG